MKIISKIINKCQFSKKKDLIRILSLGFLPGVNQMHKISSKRNFENFFPTNLVYSPSSKLFQIDNIVDKKILFPKSYPYTSSTTKILRENFKNLYEETNQLFKLKSNDLVVDIGSNDGNLLEKFKNCKVLGITPEKIGIKAIKKGIPTIIDYFTDKVVNKILKKYGKAKIITATNVFAHIDNIDEVIKNIKKLLEKNGIFISESHYFLSLVKTLQYDTIYHEHLRYYTISSLKNIFNKYNLKIIKVKKIPTHGGSIRVYVTRDSFKFKNCPSVNLAIKKEKNYLSVNKIKEFKDKVLFSKVSLLSKLQNLKKKNKKIFGVGAPSRATTLVNFVGLNEDIIDCICEIKGSYKINHFLPGTRIPIYQEDIIYKKKPDYLLLLSWHISKELIISFKKKGYKGKFIIPLPNVKIVE
jgi:2-polyprenyl-3-methyl-5-hydroxy-6-metoxy-1,4-benzoquinol methylase